jgi:hypothetical protein
MHYPERGDRQRHFMIIVYKDSKDSPPADAYVTAKFKDLVYYIDGADIVSQRNFALVSHLLTIQAIAQSPTLTPTIGVGASH